MSKHVYTSWQTLVKKKMDYQMKKKFKETKTIKLQNLKNPVLGHDTARLKKIPSKDQVGAPYQNIKNYIIAQIEAGEWMPETRIPSENNIASNFGVSRGTAHRALRELTSEGYLVGLQGIGRFVAKTKQHAPILEVKPISQEITARGETHSAIIHLVTQESATPELAMTFGLNVASPVFRSIIVHQANGLPVQLADRYVNPQFAPDYLKHDFTVITPSEYLFQLGPLTEVEHIIEAVLPDNSTQQLLEIDAHEPCLLIHRTTWSNAVAVTKVRLLYPGSRFRLGSRFKPISPAKPLTA
jgi:GntR family histidine utilization transcriptional repressor